MLTDSHSAVICLSWCPSSSYQQRGLCLPDQVGIRIIHTTSSSGSNTLRYSRVGAYCA